MGLCISALSGFKVIDIDIFEKSDEEMDAIYGSNRHFSCNNKAFLKQQGDIPSDSFYTSSESRNVLNLSYSGYGAFRESLAKLAKYPFTSVDENETEYYKDWMARNPYSASSDKLFKDNVDMPFLELVFFSDCEGIICNKIVKKLADDFDMFLNLLEGELDPMAIMHYNHFAETIRWAADNDGVLVFS